MNTATFDTLSAARSLEAAGIESKQAEAIADPAHVPRAVVEHVAAQLGIDDLSALERYWDSQTGTVKLTDLVPNQRLGKFLSC